MTTAPGALNWTLRRLGVLMTPDLSDPREAWGVLNPACARGRDGQLYLFPRLVAERNFSRVGRVRVLFDDQGTPVAVERLGVVLEPDEAWEINTTTAGVEDPRITFPPSLDLYVMAYAATGRSMPGSAWRSQTTWPAGNGSAPPGSATNRRCAPTSTCTPTRTPCCSQTR
jgi:predicted GH43/DUF377 family glycosyl hydrolase